MLLPHIRVLLCTLALLAPWAVPAADYFVAPQGNDAAPGTSADAPLKSIQKALDRAGPGDTVYLRGGTYRESAEIRRGGAPERPVTLASYRAEVPVIKGSDLVSGWEPHQGNIWKKTGWSVNSQQVFVDFDAKPGAPLRQVGMPSRFYKAFEYPKPLGQGLGDMVAGSFYYDAAASTLYVWLADGSDPNQHQVEVSTRKSLLRVTAQYVQLQGLSFRHSNVSANAQQGAAVDLGANVMMRECDVQWTDFAGVMIGFKQGGAQVIDSNISNNGSSGINAPATYGFLVSGVTLNGNNYRGFNPLWHAGGIKATTQAYGIVERSEVAYNRGSGIWFDYANGGEPIIVRNNFVHDNGPVDSAIFIEVSKNAHIYNNVLANNERRGIYLSGSDNTKVYNNTIYGTRGYAGIELGGVPRAGATLTGNQVTNNIISHGSSRYDLIIMPPKGSEIAGNQSDYNNVYRPDGQIKLSSATNYPDLRAWQAATGMDARSISADPRFAANEVRSAADLTLKPDSPSLRSGRKVDDDVRPARPGMPQSAPQAPAPR